MARRFRRAVLVTDGMAYRHTVAWSQDGLEDFESLYALAGRGRDQDGPDSAGLMAVQENVVAGQTIWISRGSLGGREGLTRQSIDFPNQLGRGRHD